MANTDTQFNDRKQNTIKDLIVQEMIIDEYIKRLLSPAEGSKKHQLMKLKDYGLNIIPECAPLGRVKSPVLFEMARIVNGTVNPAEPFLSKAGFFMFGIPGSEQSHFIETGSLKQLLLDNRGERLVKACYGGKSVLVALDRQLLLDHCYTD